LNRVKGRASSGHLLFFPPSPIAERTCRFPENLLCLKSAYVGSSLELPSLELLQQESPPTHQSFLLPRSLPEFSSLTLPGVNHSSLPFKRTNFLEPDLLRLRQYLVLRKVQILSPSVLNAPSSLLLTWGIVMDFFRKPSERPMRRLPRSGPGNIPSYPGYSGDAPPNRRSLAFPLSERLTRCVAFSLRISLLRDVHISAVDSAHTLRSSLP